MISLVICLHLEVLQWCGKEESWQFLGCSITNAKELFEVGSIIE